MTHWITRCWEGEGEPQPVDGRGRAVAHSTSPGTHCAVTGASTPRFKLSDALSSNFAPARLLDSLRFARGSEIAVTSKRSEPALSAAAVWAIRSLAFRCAPWIFEGETVEFCPSRNFPKGKKAKVPQSVLQGAFSGRTCADFLAWLLTPRPAGTVAGLPHYGIAHGGETNFHRLLWPSGATEGHLYKLQSKHTVLGARESPLDGYLRLQVDDSLSYLLNVERWRSVMLETREAIDSLTAVLRGKAACFPVAKQVLLGGPFSAISYGPAAVAEVNRFHTHTRGPIWELLTTHLYEDTTL